MVLNVRTATQEDIPALCELILEDARRRASRDDGFWIEAPGARRDVTAFLAEALAVASDPLQQAWLLADTGGGLAGLVRTLHLPVPPIYAGNRGRPGLIPEDCILSPEAPPGTLQALLSAADSGLRAQGAQVLLAASIPGGSFEAGAGSYRPLTLYMARPIAQRRPLADHIHQPGQEDIDEIVSGNASSQEVLSALDPFWAPHAEARSRFGAWMTRSLTLDDRDMRVSRTNGRLSGHVIAQPATRLHIPAAYAVGHIGVIDDFFHDDFADPDSIADDGTGARDLLAAAEDTFAERGKTWALVVCPAAWTSKRRILERAGYRTALRWFIADAAAGPAV